MAIISFRCLATATDFRKKRKGRESKSGDWRLQKVLHADDIMKYHTLMTKLSLMRTFILEVLDMLCNDNAICLTFAFGHSTLSLGREKLRYIHGLGSLRCLADADALFEEGERLRG
jgi:hypothetical protein